jgi:hypothetical protein
VREAEVPQEGNVTLTGARKAIYARSTSGTIGIAASRGWEAEEIVTLQAVNECLRLAEEARTRALNGRASPLEFHMYRARMDLALLGQATGLWRWRIRRHFRPGIFCRLSHAMLKRYADALGISIDALQKIA